MLAKGRQLHLPAGGCPGLTRELHLAATCTCRLQIHWKKCSFYTGMQQWHAPEQGSIPEGSLSAAIMKPLAALQDMHFTNNIFYFVMEFASGGTLVDYVHKQVGGQTSLLPCCFGALSKSCLLDWLLPRKRVGPFCMLEAALGSHLWLLSLIAKDGLSQKGLPQSCAFIQNAVTVKLSWRAPAVVMGQAETCLSVGCRLTGVLVRRRPKEYFSRLWMQWTIAIAGEHHSQCDWYKACCGLLNPSLQLQPVAASGTFEGCIS